MRGLPNASIAESASSNTHWKRAIVDILPLALAVVPWGILCGSFAVQVGMTALQAQLMSLMVFAGAAQLASLSLISGGTGPLLPIVGTTAIISSRHLLYSAVFRQHVRSLSLPWRMALAFFLTDEMFAVTVAYRDKTGHFHPVYALVAGVLFYLIWNCATLIGILAGTTLDDIGSYGLEFAVAATFIAITVPAIKSLPTLLTVLVSGATALICGYFNIANSQLLLLSSLSGMFAGTLASGQTGESRK